MKSLIIEVSKILCNKEWLVPYTFGNVREKFVEYLNYIVECKEESNVEKIRFDDDFFTFTVFGESLHPIEYYIELFSRDD